MSEWKIGQWLSERLGQPFVVEVRPDAADNIAAEAAARAPADGYTLLLVNAQNAISAYYLCQGKSGQDQHGIGGYRRRHPCVRRVVQDDGRRRDGSRALSRRSTRADRSARWSGTGDVQ